MSTKRVVRQYEAEFKMDAAKLVKEKGYTVSEAAERLGVPKANISRWLRQYRQGRLVSGHKQAQPTANEAELRRLKDEVKRLEQSSA